MVYTFITSSTTLSIKSLMGQGQGRTRVIKFTISHTRVISVCLRLKVNLI